MNSKKVENAYAELWGIFYAVLALLLVLSLASYDQLDTSLNTSQANKQINNAIGYVGACLSVFLFYVFGLAAWILPFLSLSASAVFFSKKIISWNPKILWSGALLVAASGLFDLQTVFGEGWKVHAGVTSVGGLVGDWMNELLLIKFLGRPGSAIILLSLYVTSLISLYGIKPIQGSIEFYGWLQEEWEKYQEAKMERTHGKLAAAEMRLDKEQRELEKSLANQKATMGIKEKRKDRDVGDGKPTREEPLIPPVPPKSALEKEVLPEVVPQRTQKKNEPLTESVSSPIKSIEPEPLVPPLEEPSVKSATAKSSKTKQSAEMSPIPTETPWFDYQLPTIELLADINKSSQVPVNEEELQYNLDLVVYTLKTFGIEVEPVGYTPGATIIRYEVLPKVGVRVDKITSLQRDLARAMKAERINILAPIPGKDTVGIETPNTSKVPVVLRELFETPEWKSTKARIPLALGKDVYGSTLMADLADMPHLLIAGTTGSGKSVCINCILLSLLYRFSPNELRLILVDPKQVEMQIYNTIPHLVVPVVVEPKKVLMALRWVINEMEKRYKILAKTGVRNITAFNNRPTKPKEEPKPEPEPVAETGEEEGAEEEQELFVSSKEEIEIPARLPYIVVIIDELADLMQTAPADVEAAIARLTAKARAAGIHLIVATQTPRREVVTGVIKTNIPCRIAFQVPSALDSRVILDESGAENLMGKGDLLYLPPGSGKFTRGQGAFVGDEEVHRIVEFCSKQSHPIFDAEIHQKLNRTGEAGDQEITDEDKELIQKCLEIIRQEKRASTSMLQRRLRIGYNRAAWVIDFLERKGILAPSDNSAKPRDILVDLDQVDPENLF